MNWNRCALSLKIQAPNNKAASFEAALLFEEELCCFLEN